MKKLRLYSNPFKKLEDEIKYENKTFNFKVNNEEYEIHYQLIYFSKESIYEGNLVIYNKKITVYGKTEYEIVESLKSKLFYEIQRNKKRNKI